MKKKNVKKILIFANLSDPHMIRFVKHLKMQDTQDLEFYFFGGDYDDMVKKNANDLKNGYFIKNYFSKRIYSLPCLKNIIDIINLYVSFIPLLKYKFDIVNIHAFGLKSFLLFPWLRFRAKTILLSPWGSDVYRISTFQKFIFKNSGYRFSDYISATGKFKNDIKKDFNISEKKIVELYFGSNLISLIESKNHVEKKESKKIINIPDSYVIVCGYNSNPNQNHNTIIDALIKIQSKLPSTTVLIFPMTYGPNNLNYLQGIKRRLIESGFKFIILETFLSEENLFHYINSADMMIHVQNSDAFSSAIKEYILCDTKVLNGNWLRYPDLEFAKVPYYLVDDLDNFSHIILQAFKDNEFIIPKELKFYLKQFSWNKTIQEWVKTYHTI